MPELFSRYTAQVMWLLHQKAGHWLEFEQIEDLANVPEKDLREILAGLVTIGFLEISLVGRLIPLHTSVIEKLEAAKVIKKHIISNDSPIPVGIASMLQYRFLSEKTISQD